MISTGTLIGMLLSLLPLALILYYFYLMRSRDLVIWDMKNGHRCLSCLDKNETVEPHWLSKEEKFVCRKCERDNSLSLLLGRKKEQLRMKFISFAISRSWDKYYFILIGGSLLLMLVGAIMGIFFDMKSIRFTDISNSINSIIWLAMIFRLRFISVKKQK